MMTRTTTTKLMMMTSVRLMSLAQTMMMAICVPTLVAAFLGITKLPRRSHSAAASVMAPMAHMEDAARHIGIRRRVDLTNQLRQWSRHPHTWYHNTLSTAPGGGMDPSRHQARPVGSEQQHKQKRRFGSTDLSGADLSAFCLLVRFVLQRRL